MISDKVKNEGYWYYMGALGVSAGVGFFAKRTIQARILQKEYDFLLQQPVDGHISAKTLYLYIDAISGDLKYSVKTPNGHDVTVILGDPEYGDIQKKLQQHHSLTSAEIISIKKHAFKNNYIKHPNSESTAERALVSYASAALLSATTLHLFRFYRNGNLSTNLYCGFMGATAGVFGAVADDVPMESKLKILNLIINTLGLASSSVGKVTSDVIEAVAAYFSK